MGLIDKIQAKLELFRLEQRYTRHRHRRSAFVSNAVYVDGEYVFQTPNSTGSSYDSANSRSSVRGIDALHGEKHVPVTTNVIPEPLPEANTTVSSAERKRLHRFSSMASFQRGASSKEMPAVQERRMSMIR
ncbi:hypothetical protein B0I35DRAFT_476245 [Stachybotrys elegans]|uniref:Uncharacterized protein n=1 Tax=Stachybotrys elegans TaxID=80388 RepID=A0A8K0T3M1_9HYPO|nr:hypothetical protein B0I35DRAFT_476245 [Stachybotrys elegans]